LVLVFPFVNLLEVTLLNYAENRASLKAVGF